MAKARKRTTRADSGDTLSFGAHDEDVGQNLIELYDTYLKLLSSRTHSKLMALNLTQWRTLTLIRYNPDQTQRTLSRAVGIDPSSMTPIIDFFEKKTWVRRLDSKDNRSAYRIRMTPVGTQAYNQIAREMKRSEELFASLVGKSARQELAGLLGRLRTALKTELMRD